MSRQFSFLAQEDGERLDKWLAARLPEMSRSGIQKLLEEGQISCGGVPLKKAGKVQAGDEITLTLPDPQPVALIPQDIPLDIVYEDADLLVVNKPKGMVVHPAPGHPDGTLVNALLFHCRESLSGINGELRPGIVHRIDRDTSGLLAVAKNDFAHIGLAEQISRHDFAREYSAVVYGSLPADSGTIHKPIGRHPQDRKRMAILPGGRDAVTHYSVVRRYEGFTRLAVRLETGRTHQIRVHMASIGHPVAGDPVYGPKKVIVSLGGQCLHAGLLGFIHPRTGESLEFTAPLPEYFTDFLEKLKPLDQ